MHEDFLKVFGEIEASLKFGENNGRFTWRHMYIYEHTSVQFFLEWEMFQAKFAEKVKTRIVLSIFSPENHDV